MYDRSTIRILLGFPQYFVRHWRCVAFTKSDVLQKLALPSRKLIEKHPMTFEQPERNQSLNALERIVSGCGRRTRLGGLKWLDRIP
jgi:hypothetical protein